MGADIIIFLIVMTVGASAVVGLILRYRFIAWLKKTQPAAWQELGSPTLFTNNSLKNYLAVRKFLKSMDSSNIGDPELAKRGRALVFFNKVYFLFFAVMFALMTYILLPH